LRGTRIVIPETLQQQTIQLAHEGHQGITKCKALLREKVWFAAIDKKVEEVVSQCIYCAANTPQNHREPLQMSELPEAKWTNLAADFYGPLPTGEMLLVIQDEYSRFPVIEVVHSTSANTTIAAMDRILSMFSTPKVIKTDNGPPFNSTQFAQFAEYMGFKHRKITPLWPRANAECERFMQSLGKILRIAHQQGTNWKQEMQSFLRSYRTSPHSTTKVSPHEMLFCCKPRTRIPEYQQVTKADDQEVRRRDGAAKAIMKAYADNRNNATECKLKIGDTVLVRQNRTNKLSSIYDPVPYKISEIKGSMITARRGRKEITRNSSFFKQLNSTVQSETEIESEQSDDDDIVQLPMQQQQQPVHAPPVMPAMPGNIANARRERYPTRNRQRPNRLNDCVVGT